MITIIDSGIYPVSHNFRAYVADIAFKSLFVVCVCVCVGVCVCEESVP